MSQEQIKFDMIKWNASTNNKTYMKRGVMIESYGGGYIADILFTSNICGFVVQEINKIYKFLNFGIAFSVFSIRSGEVFNNFFERLFSNSYGYLIFCMLKKK